MTTDKDRLLLRLESIGRIQGRYAWAIVAAAVFFLALHMNLATCEVLVLDDPGAPTGAGQLEGTMATEGGNSSQESAGIPSGTSAAENNSDLCPESDLALVTLPVVGLRLSTLVVWAAGPAILSFLALTLMGSLAAAGQTAIDLKLISRHGEVPSAFIDTEPNGIDLAFFIPDRFWESKVLLPLVARYRYYIFLTLVLLESGYLSFRSFLYWRQDDAHFDGHGILLVLGTLVLLWATLRLLNMMVLRITASYGSGS